MDAIDTYWILELRPGLGQVGILTIGWFGLNLTLGWVACWLLGKYFAAQFTIFRHILFYLAIAAVFFSKACLVFVQPEKFATVPIIRLFEVGDEGFVLTGTCLPFILFWVWVWKKKKTEWLPTLNLSGAFLCIMLLSIQLSETLRGTNDGVRASRTLGVFHTHELNIVLKELDQIGEWQIAERTDSPAKEGQIPLTISGVFRYQVTDPEGMDRYMGKEVKNVLLKTPEIASNIAIDTKDSQYYQRDGQQITIAATGFLKHPVRLYKVLVLFITLLLLGKTLTRLATSIYFTPIVLAHLLMTDAFVELLFADLSGKTPEISLQMLLSVVLISLAAWLRNNFTTFPPVVRNSEVHQL